LRPYAIFPTLAAVEEFIAAAKSISCLQAILAFRAHSDMSVRSLKFSRKLYRSIHPIDA
jgi:hypothetical protein